VPDSSSPPPSLPYEKTSIAPKNSNLWTLPIDWATKRGFIFLIKFFSKNYLFILSDTLN